MLFSVSVSSLGIAVVLVISIVTKPLGVSFDSFGGLALLDVYTSAAAAFDDCAGLVLDSCGLKFVNMLLLLLLGNIVFDPWLVAGEWWLCFIWSAPKTYIAIAPMKRNARY